MSINSDAARPLLLVKSSAGGSSEYGATDGAATSYPTIDGSPEVPIYSLHNTDFETGLTTQEVEDRLRQIGPNQLIAKKQNIFVKFLMGFWGPMPNMIWVRALACLEFVAHGHG